MDDNKGGSLSTEMRYVKDKLNIFLGEVEDEEDVDEILKKI